MNVMKIAATVSLDVLLDGMAVTALWNVTRLVKTRNVFSIMGPVYEPQQKSSLQHHHLKRRIV